MTGEIMNPKGGPIASTFIKDLSLYPQTSEYFPLSQRILCFQQKATIPEINNWSKYKNNWPHDAVFNWCIHNISPTTKAQGTSQKWVERLQDSWDQEVCCKIESSGYDVDNTPMKSQKNGCLNKTWKMTIAFDIAMRIEVSGSTLR